MAEIAKRNRHDGYFNKIKRSKHDTLKLTVHSYLARRHYTVRNILIFFIFTTDITYITFVVKLK